MNGKTVVAAAVTIGAALVAGYFVGRVGMPTVLKNETASTAATGTSAPDAESKSGQRKLLYYRNPMGLPDTSPVPKKDPMGMDYVPVYEGEDQGALGTVKVSGDRLQTLGVRIDEDIADTIGRSHRHAG